MAKLSPANVTIKRRREEAGISQERLAYLVGVSRETINRWERGDVRQIDAAYWPALADHLGGKPGEYGTDTVRVKPSREDDLRNEIAELRERIDEVVRRLGDSADS